MTCLLNSLREHPELAIFLTLAVGFVIGRIRIGSFKFGNVLGTLIAGVLIGQLDIKVDPTVKAVFFSLFLFATGYKVGPQFFRGLKKNALPQVALTVVLCVTSLVTTLVAAQAAWLRQRDRGRPDGRGVHRIDRDRDRQRHDRPARSARGREDETEEQHPCGLCGQLPGGHRIRRLVSVGRGSTPASRQHEGRRAGNWRRRCRRQARSSDEDVHLAYKEWSIRAYRLADVAAGRTVADLERSASPERVFVERIRRGAELIDAHAGDRAAIGRCRRHRGAAESAAQWKPAAWRGSRGPRASRISDGDARRGGDEAGGGGATTLRPGPATRARRRPRQIDPRRRGNSLRCRDDHQSGGPAPAGRRPAGRGARRTGGGLHRASIE